MTKSIDEYEYKVRIDRVENNEVCIVCEEVDGNDGFGIWIPIEQFKKMKKKELEDLIKQEIKRRKEFLKNIEREKKKQEEEQKKIKKYEEKLKNLKLR